MNVFTHTLLIFKFLSGSFFVGDGVEAHTWQHCFLLALGSGIISGPQIS